MLSDHSIEVNPQIEKEFGRDEVVGVIKHELCHYHLHIEGRGYKHGDSDFKALLKKRIPRDFASHLKVVNYLLGRSESTHVCSVV